MVEFTITSFLVQDNDLGQRELIPLLKKLGEVREFIDFKNLMETLQNQRPDLIFLPLWKDSYSETLSFVRHLRTLRWAHLLGIVVYCNFYDREIFRVAYRSGIDDICPLPMEETWFLAKMENIVYHLKKRVHTNALTGLPGISLIEEQFYFRQSLGEAFSVAYSDLDNFKPFNDEKGVKAGDRAIEYLALLFHELRLKYTREEIFVGHLGGDDFFILGKKRSVREFVELLYHRFPEILPQLFAPYEIARGYYIGTSRDGVEREFPLLSISTAILNIGARVIISFEKLSEMAAVIKKKAKAFSGMSVVEFYIDRSQ